MDAGLDYNQPDDKTLASTQTVPQPADVVDIDAPTQQAPAEALEIPDYLSSVYTWSYLKPSYVRLLDRELVVSVILWGQHRNLQRNAFRELTPGQRVLQPASVYGDFSASLAGHLGSEGRLEVTDIAPIQVERCREKLRDYPQGSVRQADARNPGGDPYDAVCCYFLLHEVPEDYKHQIVDAMLDKVIPGGKVVFVDYHKPHPLHPLKGIMNLVFNTLEPFAKGLWHKEIMDFASKPEDFTWRKETYFGGLYQKVVAEKHS